MDYNAPVARRTRLSEEKYWRKICEKQAGKRKLREGSDKKEKSRKESKEWDCVSLDDSEENVEASKDKKKSGKRKLHDGSDMKGKSRKGSKEWDCIYVDDSEENEEVSVSPSTKGKNKKKGGKRKSAEGSKKQRSGCDDSDDSGAASVEILSESSFGKQDNDSVGFDHVESAGSNGKNSKSVDVEDSDGEVVYLGEEKVGGSGCSSTERSDASEDTASDGSDESWKSSSSEDAISDASDESDDESFEQEKSESSVFSEESNSCIGEGHDDEREVTKTSGKPRKGKSVEGDVEVNKGKDIDASEITKGSGKAGKGEVLRLV
ncbi:hypothetical protein GBA52_016075 [Prunus armeniaca]|nr:hypothetical protein GBA52_016075 [Prunus armeniaca]